MKPGFLDTKPTVASQKKPTSSTAQTISVPTGTPTPGGSAGGAPQFILTLISFCMKCASADCIQAAVRDKQTYTNMLVNKLFRRNNDSLSTEEMMQEAMSDQNETSAVVSVPTNLDVPKTPPA